MKNIETETLLEDFPPVSTAEWQAAVARDLKGADAEKRLVWRTEEGMAAKPFYRAEDLAGLACVNTAPGDFPYQRGARTSGNWRIREAIDAANAEEANAMARAAVAAGAEQIAFSGFLVESACELDSLLDGLDTIPVHFERADEPSIQMLIKRLRGTPRAAETSTGCDAPASVEFAAEVIGAAPLGLVPFTIHGAAFREAGATTAEEIGFALAAGVDFLAAMEERRVDVNRAAAALEFSFAVGSNYFFEIAKFRAFRMLWAQAAESFGGTHEAARARIAARTLHWNQTVYDPHVNILRATTEAMAAVLGGADAVMVTPFDWCYKAPNEASRRLARNTQLLLKHEAWLGRVADAGGGSYALETITDFMAREGWKVMQDIEARGGFRTAQAEGMVAQALERSLAAREQAVAVRKRVLVGTNQYANPAERALDRVDEQRMHADLRGGRAYEELRMRTERHAAAGGKTPRVLLAEIGDVKMRAARSNFARNFFACAGFEMQTRRFKKAGEIAAADVDLIVLCSADAEYAALASALLAQLKAFGRETPVIVAGNPENAEELKTAEIADFVHVRTPPLEFLAKWQETLLV
ncbi:MAG: methylmalonyl-CoA mutase family protein [Terracidiphilus sp.]|nr:methylmalonyl-CoA mutase family protein [Terracidiphilus sp.]MDR3798886.1 methylmalonyl-CoA mutase family protein [Terracidiphilus sp.]